METTCGTTNWRDLAHLIAWKRPRAWQPSQRWCLDIQNTLMQAWSPTSCMSYRYNYHGIHKPHKGTDPCLFSFHHKPCSPTAYQLSFSTRVDAELIQVEIIKVASLHTAKQQSVAGIAINKLSNIQTLYTAQRWFG